MTTYELTNTRRKYFGLMPIKKDWDRQVLDDRVTVYFDKDKIVKVLNYDYAYLEYDTDIETIDRRILVPKTTRGKEQKFSVAKLLKIKGSGVQFSISFFGGGITVYDNKRKLCFLKSTFEDGEIRSFEDADNWINKFIDTSSHDYLETLSNQLSEKRKIQHARPGDVICFKLGRNEYGFARILKGIIKRKDFNFSNFMDALFIHPRSLTVATYAYIADKMNADLEEIINKPTLPSIYIFDTEVYYGEMPIIGHKELNELDKNISPPHEASTSVTIFYTKTDIENFIKTSRLSG
jgi:hypothetical protein